MATYSPSAVRAPSMVPRLIVAIVLLGVGLGVGIYGGITGADRFANPLSAPYQSGKFTQHLQSGHYFVYANAVNNVKETPSDLTVKAPDGSAVAVTAFSGNRTQTRGGVTYSAYAQFQAPSAGTYDLALADSGPPRIIVARTLLDTAKSLVRQAVETVVGALVALIGFIVLLRTFTRRWWRFQDRKAPWRQAVDQPSPAQQPSPAHQPSPGAEAWEAEARPPGAQAWNPPVARPGPSEPPPGGFT